MQSTIHTQKKPRAFRTRPAVVDTRTGGDRRLWLLALLVVAAAGALRLLMAAVVPLVPDEAYYWEWSRNLSTGYFDHPPLIALMIAAGRFLLGETPLAVRLVPVLCGTIGMWLVADVARRHGGGGAALRAAIVAAVVPLSAVGLVLATPDAPLLLALAASIAAVDRALAAPASSRRSTAWWMAAGVAIGVGLVGKYSAALLPFGMLLAFLACAPLRARLATAGPYLGALASFAVFLPVVLWNARHEWVSFLFQLNHGFGSGGGSVLGRQLELLASQAGLMSPVLFVLMAMVVAQAVANLAEPRRFLLGVAAVAMFGVFVYSALQQRVQPNWPAPAYVPGMVLLAVAAGGDRWRAWWRAGVIVAAVATALIYAHTLRPFLPIPAHDDPVAQAFGWGSLAETTAAHAAEEAGRPGVHVWIAANRYQDAAQLAFHLPDRPTVFSLNLNGRPNQYDFWPGFRDVATPGDRLVLVLYDGDRGDEVIRALRPHFREVTAGARVELRRGADVLEARRLWHLRDWEGGWPESAIAHNGAGPRPPAVR